MREAKFKKGPWSIHERDTEGLWAIDMGNHLSAATVVVCMEGGEENTSERRRLEGNAHLIAAAPELYEELSSLKEYLEAMHEMPPGWTIEQSQVKHKRICDLLAKARGES